MATDFFITWELWEKMVFVLACLIVAVIALGCGKLWYNNMRIRKYTAIEKQGRTYTSVETQLEAGEFREKADPDEVPFGIRALERGIEVEGVWISQPNTPSPGSPASTASATPIIRPRGGSLDISQIPRLDISQSGRQSQILEVGSRPASQDGPNRPNSSDQVTKDSRDPSPDCHIRNPSITFNRRMGPPLAFSKYSAHFSRPSRRPTSNEGTEQSSPVSAIPTNKSAPSSREASPSDRRPTTQETEQSLDFSNIGCDIADIVIEGTRSEDFNDGLDLLHTHRLSHVAETGILGSRPRRPTNESTGAVSCSARNHKKTSSVDLTSPATSTESVVHFPHSSFDTYPTIPQTQQQCAPDYYGILSSAAADQFTRPKLAGTTNISNTCADASKSASGPAIFSEDIESNTSNTSWMPSASGANPNRHGQTIKPDIVQSAFAEFEDEGPIELGSETIYPESVYSLRRELERRIAEQTAELESAPPMYDESKPDDRDDTAQPNKTRSRYYHEQTNKHCVPNPRSRATSTRRSSRTSTESHRNKLQKRDRRPSKTGHKDPDHENERPRSFSALRDSRVVRKVNSGFQILRPGSFAMSPTSVFTSSPKEDKQSLVRKNEGPPPRFSGEPEKRGRCAERKPLKEADNITRDREAKVSASGSTGPRRKLQKRTESSSVDSERNAYGDRNTGLDTGVR